MVDNDDPIMIRQIINATGYDTETGIYGVGYSPDNGKTFYVQNTSAGRKFRQQDADGLWPFLIDKVKAVMSGSLNVDWSDIQNKPDLSQYVTKDELPAQPDLSGYAKTSDIPKSMDWNQITDKPSLALTSDIPSLDGYAKLTDIPSITGLVKEAELDNYAKKADLPDFSQFAKKSEIPELPDTSNFATKDAVQEIQTSVDSATNKAEQAQSTADANTKALQNVYTKEEADRKYWTAEQEQNASNVKSVNNVKPDDQGNVDINLTGYAKIDDIPKSMSWDNITGKPDLVTNDQLAYNMQHALATIDQAKTKIDTSDLHVIKKPSDYPDGFSYELKSMSALGIDRTNSHPTAQVGDMGLLITKAVSYDNTKYVRQTLEQLDNSRPLNYVRNGHDETWFDWEDSTTW